MPFPECVALLNEASETPRLVSLHQATAGSADKAFDVGKGGENRDAVAAGSQPETILLQSIVSVYGARCSRR